MEVRVQVSPRSTQEGVDTLRDGRLRIRVKPGATRGAANARAKEILAHHIGVESEAVTITRGAHSRVKTFQVYERR
jgi:hypothetical protein